MSQLGRDLDPEVLAQLVTMVDRTTYSDEARTPKIALRQIFGRLGLRQELCKLAADSGLLSIEVVAMLGDTAAAVKATLKTLVDAAALGADEAARELSLMQIAAVWHACHALQTQFATRRAKMEEDPSKVPEMAQEDHAEFRGRFVRNHPDVVSSGCEGAAQEVRREAQQGFLGAWDGPFLFSIGDPNQVRHYLSEDGAHPNCRRSPYCV